MTAATDRLAVVQALNAGIMAYLAVLKNATRQEEAAYNYEYLVRLREEVAKGRRTVSAQMRGPHGRAGGVPAKSENDFKVYVPQDSKERQKGAEAGKSAPIKRKG